MGDTATIDARQPEPGYGRERESLVGGRDARTVARYFAREREKQELRRERDVAMLRIARDLGEGALAKGLDVSPAVVGTLIAGARERLDASTYTVRNTGADRDRWAEVDTYYEALGSRPPISPRRPPPSRS